MRVIWKRWPRCGMKQAATQNWNRCWTDLSGALSMEESGATGNAEAEQVPSLVRKPMSGRLPGRRSPLAERRSQGRRRWAAVGALAAACLLAFLFWSARGGNHRVPNPPLPTKVPDVAARSLDDSEQIAVLLTARRDLEETKPLAFTWPLPEALPMRQSMAIPDELLH